MDYPRRFTLLDTGAFYDSMKVIIKSNYFFDEGNTKKGNKDLATYSPTKNILGLNDTSIDILIEYLKPFMVEQLLK
jgi:hypothetical protein